MSQAAYAYRRNQNLYRRSATLSMGPISAGLVVVVAIGALSLLYLNQITKTSIYGYKKTELETTRANLTAAKRELEVEAARLKSIATVGSSPNVAKMVTEQNVSYAKN